MCVGVVRREFRDLFGLRSVKAIAQVFAERVPYADAPLGVCLTEAEWERSVRPRCFNAYCVVAEMLKLPYEVYAYAVQTKQEVNPERVLR